MTTGLTLYGPDGLGSLLDTTRVITALAVDIEEIKRDELRGILAKVVATAPVSIVGLPVIDGYQTLGTDVVLLTAQASAVDNGPWLVGPASWSRPAAFADGSGVEGATVVVTGGTLGAGTVWALRATAPIQVGTDAQTWVSTPVAGLPAALAALTQADATEAASRADADTNEATTRAAADAATNAALATKADAAGTTAALATKAADSAVVHNTGDETVAGAKTFTGDQVNTSGRPWRDLTGFPGVDRTGATDSTVGVKNAIALGGVFLIPPNSTIDVQPGQLVLNNIYSTIICDGPTAVLRCSSGVGPFVIRIYNASVTSLSNLQVQVSGTAKITGSAVEIDALLGNSTEHFEARNIYVSNQGAQGDRTARNASTTAGSNTVTIDAADPPFTSGDTGGMLAVGQAGPDLDPLVGFMTFVDATHVTLTDAPGGSPVNATFSKAGVSAHYFSAASAIMVNGIGIGTSKQAATQDVAETNWYSCKATRCLVNALLVGPQLSGNVINHRFYGFEGTNSFYGVAIAGSNVAMYGGTLEGNIRADVKLYGAGDGSIVIDGVRSENSYMFWECLNNGTSVSTVSLRSVQATHVKHPSGKAGVHQSAGSLSVRDSVFHAPSGAGVTDLSFDLAGVDATHPLHFVASNVGIETSSLSPFGTDPNTVRELDWYRISSAGLTLASPTGRVIDDTLTVKGGLVAAKAKLPAAATSGFTWLPTITAPPTGIPDAKTGGAAIVVGDDGNLYLRSPASGIWVAIGTGGAGGTSAGQGIFGDGSDGAFVVPVGTTTLTHDMYYTTLVVPSGATLITAGYRVFCLVSCDIQAGGVVHNDGAAAAGAVAGIAGTGGTLGPGRGGTAGSTSVATTPAALGFSLGGAGGAGGLGTSGAGGSAGAVTVAPASYGQLRGLPQMTLGHFIGGSNFTAANGGGAGAGGGGDGGGSGGGGGGGAGLVLIVAKALIINGTLRAAGGNGGNGGGTNTGGGGGGGGGALLLAYNTKSGSASALTQAANCPGGIGGAKTGTGVAGSNGSNGSIRELVNQS